MQITAPHLRTRMCKAQCPLFYWSVNARKPSRPFGLLFKWAKPGLNSFYMCRAIYAMRGKIAVGFMAALRSTGARQHAETLHGIASGFIIVQLAPFRRPLSTFHQQLSSTPRHRVGEAKT
jgi:hypothetical protein